MTKDIKDASDIFPEKPLNNRRISIVPAVQTKPITSFAELLVDKHYLVIGGVRWNYTGNYNGLVFNFENGSNDDENVPTQMDLFRKFSKEELVAFVTAGMLYTDMPVQVRWGN